MENFEDCTISYSDEVLNPVYTSS